MVCIHAATDSRVDINIDLANRIRRQQKKLLTIVEPHFGLLDELYSRGVLTQQRFESLRQRKIPAECNRRLITHLVNRNDVIFTDVLAALENTHQKHVANFILQSDGWFLCTRLNHGGYRPTLC